MASINPGNRKDQLVEIAKAIAAILGVPLVLFSIIQSIFGQPVNALIVTLFIAILASIWVVRSHWTGITEVTLAWLVLIVLVLASFVLWPKTITVQGIVRDSTGQPLRNELVVLFDYTNKRYENTTNSEGYYQFRDVPTGQFKVIIRGFEVIGATKGILVRVVQQDITSPAVTPTSTIGLPMVQSSCPDPLAITSSIRIQKVAKACGCQAGDFDIIQIDSQNIRVTGGWYNPQPETELWAFLVDSENDAVLRAPKRVIPDVPGQPNWNISLFIPEEADKPGRTFTVYITVLDQGTAQELNKDPNNNTLTTLLALNESQPHQEVLIERVEDIEDQASVCPRAL